MSLTLSDEDVKKIAHLARLNLSEQEIAHYAPQLTGILNFIEQLNQADTTDVEPLAHPLDISQRLREDKVTEPNLRDKYQQFAPEVQAGLYVVPKVIE